MFRLAISNLNNSKTEFIKKEVVTDCNEVIEIHPYAEEMKGATDGKEKIEPEAASSSSGFLNNNQVVSSSAAEEQHTM